MEITYFISSQSVTGHFLFVCLFFFCAMGQSSLKWISAIRKKTNIYIYIDRQIFFFYHYIVFTLSCSFFCTKSNVDFYWITVNAKELLFSQIAVSWLHLSLPLAYLCHWVLTYPSCITRVKTLIYGKSGLSFSSFSWIIQFLKLSVIKR